MTKAELVKRICNKRKDTLYTTASKSVEILLEQMSSVLEQGDRIEIRGFGAFFTRRYENSKFWNPKTRQKLGEKTKIRVRFKVSTKILKSLANKAINYKL